MIKKEETIHISWCHGGDVDNAFAICLLDIARKFPGIIHSYGSIYGIGLLSKSRNMMVKYFLDETDAAWMLMVDTDQFLSLDAFSKLVSSADSQSYPVVSGLVFGNTTEFDVQPSPCIFNVTKDGAVAPIRDYERDSLIDVYAAGTGCLLLHRSVLEKMRDAFGETSGKDWAWFEDGPIGKNVWLSEDLMFSSRLQALGIRIAAHTGATLPHHKRVWITEDLYLKSLKNK
jgi:hypothetical protein